ncbi:MAG TPA: alpha/beta hydrolase family protein [Acidimicrobiia bacterium]|nr:alpha/beta hydrolase family protein [Acidimicrobiia bacterium]
MKRCLRTLALASLASLVSLGPWWGGAIPSARADEHCTRIQDRTVPVPSGVLVPDSRVRVIVPTAYCTEGNTTAYPVLYLLHGAGDTWATWTNNTDVEEFSAAFDVIIVMPDGGHGTTPGNEAGWYSDWHDGSRDWETFHTDVLIDWVDATYRTLDTADHRAVAGLSMGGFGAMSYAGRHPDLFSAAASFSGAVDTMHGWPANGFGYQAAQPFFGTPDDRVWGDAVTNADEWRAHNPADLAPALVGKTLVLATGTGTPGGPAGDNPSNPGGYGVEAFIFQLNVSFQAHLRVAGAAFTDQGYLGGLHDWPYWEMALHHALPVLVNAID